MTTSPNPDWPGRDDHFTNVACFDRRKYLISQWAGNLCTYVSFRSFEFADLAVVLSAFREQTTLEQARTMGLCICVSGFNPKRSVKRLDLDDTEITFRLRSWAISLSNTATDLFASQPKASNQTRLVNRQHGEEAEP